MAGTCHSQGVLRLCWCGSQWPRLSLWHLGTTHIPAGVAMPGWVCGAAGWAWGEFRRGSGPAHRHACLYLLPHTCTQVHVCPLCLGSLSQPHLFDKHHLFKKFFYIFKIFAYTGSSLLHRLFSSCSEQESLSSCAVRASHSSGLSHCGTQL